MNAIQKLFEELKEILPEEQFNAIRERYRANAAADSRASYQRQKERTQKMKAERAALRQQTKENESNEDA